MLFMGFTCVQMGGVQLGSAPEQKSELLKGGYIGHSAVKYYGDY